MKFASLRVLAPLRSISSSCNAQVDLLDGHEGRGGHLRREDRKGARGGRKGRKGSEMNGVDSAEHAPRLRETPPPLRPSPSPSRHLTPGPGATRGQADRNHDPPPVGPTARWFQPRGWPAWEADGAHPWLRRRWETCPARVPAAEEARGEPDGLPVPDARQERHANLGEHIGERLVDRRKEPAHRDPLLRDPAVQPVDRRRRGEREAVASGEPRRRGAAEPALSGRARRRRGHVADGGPLVAKRRCERGGKVPERPAACQRDEDQRGSGRPPIVGSRTSRGVLSTAPAQMDVGIPLTA